VRKFARSKTTGPERGVLPKLGGMLGLFMLGQKVAPDNRLEELSAHTLVKPSVRIDCAVLKVPTAAPGTRIGRPE
jgi:hypothetical protein